MHDTLVEDLTDVLVGNWPGAEWAPDGTSGWRDSFEEWAGFPPPYHDYAAVVRAERRAAQAVAGVEQRWGGSDATGRLGLSLKTALRLWSAAAGLYGAYLPQELLLLEPFARRGNLAALEAEAWRRACWRADQEASGQPHVIPRRAITRGSRLVWRSSVDTILAPDAADYFRVEIVGLHPERSAAAQAAYNRRNEPPANRGE